MGKKMSSGGLGKKSSYGMEKEGPVGRQAGRQVPCRLEGARLPWDHRGMIRSVSAQEGFGGSAPARNGRTAVRVPQNTITNCSCRSNKSFME